MDCILITEEPLLLEEIVSSTPAAPCCGALLWFCGLVRDEHDGQKVSAITYESYAAMAAEELQRIVVTMREHWNVHRVVVVHRMGFLSVGEVSLIASIASSHRLEAFESLQYLIDELKKRVPIWKKEHYAAGPASWIGA